MAQIFLFLGCLLSSSSFAVKEYYSLSRSLRALGMGGAFYGLSNDEYALFYNPASLNLYNGSGELMLSVAASISNGGLSNINTVQKALEKRSGSDFIGALSPIKNSPIFASAGVFPAYVKRGLAVGLLIADIKTNAAYMGKEIDSAFELTAISDSGLFVAKAFPLLGKNLSAGVTSKFLLRAGGRKQFTLLDFATSQTDTHGGFGVGAGFDFDLGFTYDFPSAPIGKMTGLSLVFNNLMATQFSVIPIFGAPPSLVRTVSLGSYAVVPGGKVFEYFLFQVDLAEIQLGGQSDPDLGARTGSLWKHLNLGLETPFHGWLFVRAGLHQGNPTGGIGVSLPGFRLEFATYAEELESTPSRLTSRRFALRLALGYGTTPRAPYAR